MAFSPFVLKLRADQWVFLTKLVAFKPSVVEPSLVFKVVFCVQVRAVVSMWGLCGGLWRAFWEVWRLSGCWGRGGLVWKLGERLGDGEYDI